MFNFLNKNFSIFSLTQSWLNNNNVDNFSAEVVTSTNNLAKEEALKIDTPLKVYLTTHQTAGRGRGTNTWINSDQPNNFMSTWSFSLSGPAQAVSGPIIGLHVYQSLTKSFPEAELSLKAPNDIYLDGKKLLGILVESISSGDKHRIVIGIGLNVFSHPKEIENSIHLAKNMKIKERVWLNFLNQLKSELTLATRNVLGAHLTSEQRDGLLLALNKNPNLEEKYTSISPFGDLASNSSTITWRDL